MRLTHVTILIQRRVLRSTLPLYHAQSQDSSNEERCTSILQQICDLQR